MAEIFRDLSKICFCVIDEFLILYYIILVDSKYIVRQEGLLGQVALESFHFMNSFGHLQHVSCCVLEYKIRSHTRIKLDI